MQRVEVGTVSFQPPRSRFITSAVPTNNFGVNARFEVGAVQMQTLAGDPEGQPGGRPDLHHRADHQPDAGPPAAGPRFRVGPVLLGGGPGAHSGLSRARHPERGQPPGDAGGQAGAGPGLPLAARQLQQPAPTPTSAASPRRHEPSIRRHAFGPVQWELLIQNVDYYLDPSGLWFALSTKLDPNATSRSATSPETGRRSAAFRPTDRGAGSTDSLRLIVAAQWNRVPAPRPPSGTRCGRSTGWRGATWSHPRSR